MHPHVSGHAAHTAETHAHAAETHGVETHVTGLHVLAHSGLRVHFDSPHAQLGTLRSGLGRVDFVDEEDLTAPGGALDLPVLIPVTSEFQAEGLRAVRVRHPLSLLVAVTTDVSGYRTYYAIRSGANFVLNLAIPGETQIDMLYAQFRAHRTALSADAAPGAAAPAAPAAPVPAPVPAAACLQALPAAGADRRSTARDGTSGTSGTSGPLPCDLPAHDRELMELLCTSMTVSEIARRHYCSERSMYRRIRRLYDELGVAGRTELMALAAVLGPRRAPTARAS